MSQPTSSKMVLAAPPPEEKARPGVQVTRTQLLQGYNELLENFDSALVNQEFGKAVRIYKLAEQVEREVLRPSGLSAFASRNAQLAREFDDVATAKIYEDLSIGGFRRAATARGVNIDHFISTKTAQGIRANFTDVAENDAAKMEQVNFGKYDGDDAPIVREKMRIIDNTGNDAHTRQQMFRVLDESANLLESSFDHLGTKAERSRFAVTFARHAMVSNVEPSQFAPAMDALLGFGQKALTLPGVPASGLVVDDEGSPPRPPSAEKVFNFASTTLATIRKTRPGYEPAVTRMLSEGLVAPEDVPEGQTAEGLAAGLATLAPLVSQIERVAQSMTSGMDEASISARRTFAKTALRAFAAQKNLDLFKPDPTLDSGANALLGNVMAYAADPSDTSALVGVVAASSGVTQAGVVNSALDDAVANNKLEQAKATEIKQAITTKQEVEGSPELQDLYGLMHSDVGTGVFAKLAQQVPNDPYVAERIAFANRIDAANDAAKKGAAVKAPTPHATVDHALAASLGIDRDSSTLSRQEKDKLERAKAAYTAIWNPIFLGSRVGSANRFWERVGLSGSLGLTEVAALFTDETVDAAARRKLLDKDLKIGRATLKYADLFPTDKAVDAFLYPESISSTRATGEGVYATLPVHARRAAMIKDAVDRGLREGWLVWDADKNTLANATNTTAEQVRDAQKKSGDSAPTKVVLKSNDILPGAEVAFDLAKPGDFAAATRFIMLKPSPDQAAADAINEWRAAQATYARKGELVASYESAYSTFKKAGPLIRSFLTEGSGQKKSSGRGSSAGFDALAVRQMLNLGLGASGQDAMTRMEQSVQRRYDLEKLRLTEKARLERDREKRAYDERQKELDRRARLAAGQDPVAAMSAYKQLTEEPPEDEAAQPAVSEDSEAPVPVDADTDFLYDVIGKPRP